MTVLLSQTHTPPKLGWGGILVCIYTKTMNSLNCKVSETYTSLLESIIFLFPNHHIIMPRFQKKLTTCHKSILLNHDLNNKSSFSHSLCAWQLDQAITTQVLQSACPLKCSTHLLGPHLSSHPCIQYTYHLS